MKRAENVISVIQKNILLVKPNLIRWHVVWQGANKIICFFSNLQCTNWNIMKYEIIVAVFTKYAYFLTCYTEVLWYWNTFITSKIWNIFFTFWVPTNTKYKLQKCTLVAWPWNNLKRGCYNKKTGYNKHKKITNTNKTTSIIPTCLQIVEESCEIVIERE